MRYELQGRTDAGRDLIALAERLAEDFATRAGRTRPRRELSVRDRPGARRRRATWPRRCPASSAASGWSRSMTCSSPRAAWPAATPAVAIGVNMHLIPVTGMAHRWRAAALRGDERRARAFGRSLERVSPRGGGHGRRHQRAAPGPHPTGHDRPPDAPRAGPSTDGRSSAPCRPPPRCSTRRSRSRTRTAPSATATPRSRPTPPACGCTTTGTPSGCGPRAASPSPSRTCGCRRRRCAEASPPAA